MQKGRSKTQVAYAKGEAKERVREKMQKVDWKPERVVYAKGETKERVWESLLDWKPKKEIKKLVELRDDLILPRGGT